MLPLLVRGSTPSLDISGKKEINNASRASSPAPSEDDLTEKSKVEADNSSTYSPIKTR